MASIGHQTSAAEPRVHGVPPLAATAMHPRTGFPNAVSSSDYRERYTMETTHPYHMRSPSPLPLNRSGPAKAVTTSYQQQPQQQQQMPIEASSSPIWQQHASTGPGADMLPHHQRHGSTHFQSVDNSGISGGPGGGSSSRVSAMLGITSPESVSRGSPAASRQSSTSELYEVSGGTPSVSGGGGDWSPMMDSSMRYKMSSSMSLLSSNSSVTGSPLQQQVGNFGGMNEGAMIRELIGRLGGGMNSSTGTLASPSPPLISSRHVAAGGFGSRVENKSQLVGGFKLGGMANQNNWNPVEMMAGNAGSLIVDPSKGGLSLNSCAAGSSGSLPSSSSRCLSPFSSDPGFAERAARFSSFNGNENYQQQQQHNFSSNSDEEEGARALRSGSAGGVGGGASCLSENSSKHISGNAAASGPRLPSSRDRELSAGDPSSGISNCARPDRHSSQMVIDGGHIISGPVGAAAKNHSNTSGLHESAEFEQNLVERESMDRPFALRNVNLSPTTSLGKSFVGRGLSRRNALIATTNLVDQDDAQGGERCVTSGGNDGPSSPAGRIRGILTSIELDRQQVVAATAAPSEVGAAHDICHSSAGESTYPADTSEKKRKLEVDVRPSNVACDVAGSTSSSRGDRDGKTAVEVDESKGKRPRRGDGGSKEKEEGSAKAAAAAAERSSSETSGETSPRPSAKKVAKPIEAPKPDYIHVRARRGQATDSHSLAERVRREKISERMKFLQDLVPGCSKVTGKATMLDEIINYVQSLQRQVEFLSMKLASVSPRLDFNLESLVEKESPHPSAPGLLEIGSRVSFPPLQQQHSQSQHHQALEYQLQSTEAALRRTLACAVPAISPHISGFGDGGPALWDGELQSIVQIGLGQSPSTASSPSSHYHLTPGQVKVELQQSSISCL